MTLGTWSIFGALNFWYSPERDDPASRTSRRRPRFLQWFGTTIASVGAARLTYGVDLHDACWSPCSSGTCSTAPPSGRHIYAIGDDPEAARLSGINARRTLIAVYTLAGLICALAGWVLIGRIGAIIADLGRHDANIDSITAVVIGGTSLFGGRGSIVGTLVGRPDRRRVPQRPGAGRRRRALAGSHDRRC